MTPETGMNILVFNCGSSSLKYRLLAMPGEDELAGGEAQRVGTRTSEPSRILYRFGKHSGVHFAEMPDHASAFGQVLHLIEQHGCPFPGALAHRIVHGGRRFRDHVRVDEQVLASLEETCRLAPLHNPPQLGLVRECARRFPDLAQVLVFDTAFHSAIPARAGTYALPASLRCDLEMAKFGFHGISHAYVAAEAARFLGIALDRLRAVSCHLGSGGASLCAIVDGRSVDTTMGYSPLQGLVMSTRCGDLDPAVALRLLSGCEGDPNFAETLLNRRSGVLGLSGRSSDLRDLLAGKQGEDREALRAVHTIRCYTWRLRKYLGAYLAVVGSPHAVIFTDTLGETVPEVRAAACAGMDAFGLQLDAERNASSTTLPVDVATSDSPVRILALATNEELAIARTSYAIIGREARK